MCIRNRLASLFSVRYCRDFSSCVVLFCFVLCFVLFFFYHPCQLPGKSCCGKCNHNTPVISCQRWGKRHQVKRKWDRKKLIVPSLLGPGSPSSYRRRKQLPQRKSSLCLAESLWITLWTGQISARIREGLGRPMAKAFVGIQGSECKDQQQINPFYFPKCTWNYKKKEFTSPIGRTG